MPLLHLRPVREEIGLLGHQGEMAEAVPFAATNPTMGADRLADTAGRTEGGQEPVHCAHPGGAFDKAGLKGRSKGHGGFLTRMTEQANRPHPQGCQRFVAGVRPSLERIAANAATKWPAENETSYRRRRGPYDSEGPNVHVPHQRGRSGKGR